MAKWKDGGGLERGQLAHSERFLATRWNRPRSWVTRFLEDLEEKDRIKREPQAGRKPGRITICNYDTYQKFRTTSGATSEPRIGPKYKEQEQEEDKPPIVPLWDIWLEELGGDPPHARLTRKRKDKLRALYDECLSQSDDPLAMFRKVLRAVKRSEHHMSDRAYQFPESLFRNEERRDRWVAVARNGGPSRKPKHKPVTYETLR